METVITLLLVFCFALGALGYCITSMWMLGPILNRLPGNPEKYMPPTVRKIYNFCFWLVIASIVTGFTLDISTRWLGIR